MDLGNKVKLIFKTVLDIEPEEIDPDLSLEQSLGMDSTEMVEITVAIKKEFGLDIENNAIKKSMTLKQIVQFLESKGAEV